MTMKEAINYIEHHNHIDDVVKDMAIESLKKQITMEGIPYDSSVNHRFVECPNCHGNMGLYYKYCHHCGQAVRWSEADERE